jgi:hypothetical protein
MSMKTRILVVVSVGVLLGAVLLLPSYIKSRTVSSKNACVCVLKQIDGAKATWALENHKPNSDVPTEADLYGRTNYIRDVPECPGGGRYIIGRIDQMPRCSLPRHFLDYSEIRVVDEFGAPLNAVRIEVQRTSFALCVVETHDRGYATLCENSEIVASNWWSATTLLHFVTNGYRPERVPMPTMWPLQVTMKKETN